MSPFTTPQCPGLRSKMASCAAPAPFLPSAGFRLRMASCRAHPEGQSSAIGEDLLRSSMLDEASRQRHLEQGQTLMAPQPPSQHAVHSPTQHKPVMSSAVSGISWQQWLSYFEGCDAAAERMDELSVSLKDAVRQENYQLAASLKAELTVLEDQDAVAVVQKKLKAALADERYGDAAVLSQGGLTGLAGWWAGQSEDDPVGHLLHIRQDYSRWTGRVFRPRDVADMKVNKASSFGRSMSRPSMPTNKPTGSPVFEVFVRNKAAAGGEPHYLHQAVSLQLAPLQEEQGADQQDNSIDEDSDQQAPKSVVRLSVSVRQDGTARIRPLPVKASPAASSAAGDSSDRHRSSSGGSTSSSFSPPRPVPSIGSDAVVDLASQNAMSSLEESEETVSQVTIISEHRDSGDDGGAVLVPSGVPRFGLGARYSLPRPIGLDESDAELVRLPARIELVSRDKLVYHVPDYQPTALSRPSWADAAAEEEEGAVSASEEEGALHFEVIVPMVSNGPCSPAAVQEQGLQLETLRDLADKVAQSMDAKSGQTTAAEDIVQAMQDVLQRVAQGEAMSSVDVVLGGNSKASSSGSRTVAGLRDPLRLSRHAATLSVTEDSTTITYKRIASDQARTDPLSGLYLGSFGPHGPELLHLARSMVDGEEVVLATKLTGDANVPAGLVSFRAKVGRKHRMDGRDIYPDELGITARYKGEGRVAQRGFSQPKWVEGELLVFNAKGNPLTAGAELGFVWAVPGEKRFLILLNRVELN